MDAGSTPEDPRKADVHKDLVDNYHLEPEFAKRAVDRFFADMSPEMVTIRKDLQGEELTDELYERTEYFDEKVNGYDPLSEVEEHDD